MLTSHDVAVTARLQAYAEYRLFTGMARYETLIRRVSVTIGHNASHRDPFLCLVVVDLAQAKPIKTRARGRHPNAAIDRAADQVASLLSRHVPRQVSS
jgi:ribosome-associated translation inhibitor RaiA